MQARIDYLMAVCLGLPIGRLVGRRPRRIPILMYHSITEGPGVRGGKYYDLRTSPKQFAAHMRQLKADGYQTVDLHDLESVAQRAPESAKLVALTFDDGSRSVYTDAFPILLELGFGATVFLPTDYIHDSRGTFGGDECLTWDEAREMATAGIVFGSHTASHPELATLRATQIEEEIVKSKQVIEDRLARRVDTFAIPYGFPSFRAGFRQQLRELLIKAGYQVGVTTLIGRYAPGDDLLFLPRLPANNWDDSLLLHAKLTGGYDCVRRLQALIKWHKSGYSIRSFGREDGCKAPASPSGSTR